MRICVCWEEIAGSCVHVLLSTVWHSSPVIGHLKQRSCFGRNDFLSAVLDNAAAAATL